MLRLLNFTSILICVLLISCIRNSDEESNLKQNNIEYLSMNETKSVTDSIVLDCEIRVLKYNDENLKFLNNYISKKLTAFLWEEEQSIILDQSELEKLVDKFVMNLSSDYADVGNDVPSTDFYINILIDTVYKKNDIITINDSYEIYTGGAHGNYISNYSTYDINSKSILHYNDIFESDKIKEIAEKYFLKSQGIEKAVTDWEQEGYWFENNSFQLTNNFYIENEKLIFVYNPYEIASYAQGRIDIEIPFNALGSAVKDKYKYLIN